MIHVVLRDSELAGKASRGNIQAPGADILVGFLKRTPSCQWYSNLHTATVRADVIDMVGRGEPGTSTHGRAFRRRAELCDRAVLMSRH